MNANEKYTNPKDVIGSDKVPLSLFPAAALEHGSLAMLEGALKYGRDNFRVAGVRSSIYVDAALRHIMAWNNGEDVAPDSGVSHLGHVLACVAIILDAQAQGSLTDDRKPYQNVGLGFAAAQEQVKAMREKYADKNPKHYTLADVPPPITDDPKAVGLDEPRCPMCGSHLFFNDETRLEKCSSPKCGYAVYIP